MQGLTKISKLTLGSPLRRSAKAIVRSIDTYHIDPYLMLAKSKGNVENSSNSQMTTTNHAKQHGDGDERIEFKDEATNKNKKTLNPSTHNNSPVAAIVNVKESANNVAIAVHDLQITAAHDDSIRKCGQSLKKDTSTTDIETADKEKDIINVSNVLFNHDNKEDDRAIPLLVAHSNPIKNLNVSLEDANTAILHNSTFNIMDETKPHTEPLLHILSSPQKDIVDDKLSPPKVPSVLLTLQHQVKTMNLKLAEKEPKSVKSKQIVHSPSSKFGGSRRSLSTVARPDSQESIDKSPCKHISSYNREEAREYIKKQQAKRKAEMVSKNNNQNDLIKSRLNALKQTQRDLVHANVQKRRKRKSLKGDFEYDQKLSSHNIGKVCLITL